jgi:hypothetical protein
MDPPAEEITDQPRRKNVQAKGDYSMGKLRILVGLLGIRRWNWALLDQEANFLNSRRTHVIENFGNPAVPRPSVGPDVNLSLCALVEALPDFRGQLAGRYQIATVEDFVVTKYGNYHGVFSVCVRHRNGMADPRQNGLYATMNGNRQCEENHQNHERKNDSHMYKRDTVDPGD